MKQTLLILFATLLSGCTLSQITGEQSDATTPNVAAVKCPIKSDPDYDYSRAQEVYARVSERWRGRTIQRYEPAIRSGLDQATNRISYLYSQARQTNPCLEGRIDWVIAFRNDGTIEEIQQLWSSIHYPPLEFELSRAISELRLLPIAAPKSSVYLLPITFRADATHPPTLTPRSFAIQ